MDTLKIARSRSDEGRLRVLTAFNAALMLEAHVLRKDPHILWQQTYNRLQWEDRMVQVALGPAVHKRTQAGAAAWIRTRGRPAESRALIRTLAARTVSVFACAITPDGLMVVSVEEDGTVRRRLTSGVAELKALVGHNGWAYGCACSPDGGSIVSAGADRILQVWDAVSGRRLRTLSGHGREVRACAFSPDGHLVVSASDDGMLMLWDLTTETPPATLFGHAGAVHACAFAPDGRVVVSGGADGSIRLWDVRSGKELPRRALGHSNGVSCCAVSPDGATMASGGLDGTLQLSTMESGDLLQVIRVGAEEVRACSFSPDGLSIVSGDSSGALRIWSVESGSLLTTLVGHTEKVNGCTFAPNGTMLVSASQDGTIRIWSSEIPDAEVAGSRGSADAPDPVPVPDIGFDTQGRSVIAASGSWALMMLRARAGGKVPSLDPQDDAAIAIAPNPDMLVAVLAEDDDKTVQVWAQSSRSLLATLPSREPTTACALSPGGDHALRGGRFGTLELWDVPLGQLAWTRKDGTSVNCCTFSPDGGLALAGVGGGTLVLCDASDGRLYRTLGDGRWSAESCVFSPDGRYALWASYDRLIAWDSWTNETREFSGHDASVSACAFSPDGRLIMSAGVDRTLRLWDVGSAKELETIVLAESYFYKIAFHPTEPRACAEGRSTIHVVDLIGTEYGPIVVTAYGGPDKLTVRCPGCGALLPVVRTQLGWAMVCQNSECQRLLVTNTYSR